MVFEVFDFSFSRSDPFVSITILHRLKESQGIGVRFLCSFNRRAINGWRETIEVRRRRQGMCHLNFIIEVFGRMSRACERRGGDGVVGSCTGGCWGDSIGSSAIAGVGIAAGTGLSFSLWTDTSAGVSFPLWAIAGAGVSFSPWIDTGASADVGSGVSTGGSALNVYSSLRLRSIASRTRSRARSASQWS